MSKCKVEGCNNKVHGKGYCSKHYQQFKRHGKILDRSHKEPNKIVLYEDYAEIILCNKQYEEVARALIDLDDVDKVKNRIWYMDNGYAKSNKNKSYSATKLHRFVTDCPDDMVVDHINHNGLDNRKSNLRICTQQQNTFNKNKRVNNTSGVAGVRWNKQNNKWRSTITYNGNHVHLGYYSDLETAIQARKNAEIEYFGEYKNDYED